MEVVIIGMNAKNVRLFHFMNALHYLYPNAKSNFEKINT